MLKKILAVVLSMGLLLTVFPNQYVAAEDVTIMSVENDAEVREMMLSKAIEAFPEYEKEIRGENEINLGKARSGGIGEIVISETRRLSETDVVTYTQYDSGIATAAVGLGAGKKDTYMNPQGAYTDYYMNVWLTCGNSPDYIFVKDFRYRVYPSAYDEIGYTGILDNDLNTAGSVIIEEYVKNETAEDPARAVYGGYFSFTIYSEVGDLPYYIYGRLIVEVENGSYTLSSSY